MEMAFGSQKAGCLILALLAGQLLSAEVTYRVRHDHLFRDRPGVLVLDRQGISFKEVTKKKMAGHSGRWNYEDLQQILLAPDRIVLVTYRDRKWRLGIDQEYEFRLLAGQDITPAYTLLKDLLDRRLVAALADPAAAVLWEVPVKLLGAIEGSEGVLRVGPDRIVYETARRRHSRTWRYQDIDNVSSSDPYRLTLTTYERAKLDYGGRKSFHFALKRPLAPGQYDLLWRKLNSSKQLDFLSSIQETKP
jgi:hypothetical protein